MKEDKYVIKRLKYGKVLVFHLILLLCLLTNCSFAIYELNDVQKALQEVAYAYYMRGPKLQYKTERVSYHSPEEATSQKFNYLVCSGLTRNVYRELLGITIPKITVHLNTYAKEHIGSKEVVAYGHTEKENDKYVVHMQFKEDNGYKEIIKPTVHDILAYLRVGDVVTYYNVDSDQGHTMLVYDLIYDDNGNVIDAYIMQSTGGRDGAYINSKLAYKLTIKDVLSFGNTGRKLFLSQFQNDIYDDSLYEGTIVYSKLIATDKENKVAVLNKVDEPTSNLDYSILRFTDIDKNGKVVLNYKTSTETDEIKDGQIINLSNKSKNRIKYSRLYIEKTVNAYAGDVVEPGDVLEYTIHIKNNSKKDYTSKTIATELLTDNVSYISNEVNKSDAVVNVSKDKITWDIGYIKSGEEVIIKYRVKVNETVKFGTLIESIGDVNSIPTSIVINNVGKNLNVNDEEKIKASYEKLANIYTGKELLNEIYKDALGYDLEIDKLNIKDLVKEKNKNTASSTSFELNKNNSFYNGVLNKYYGLLYQKSYTYKDYTITYYQIKEFKDYNNRLRRADTIYPENFKTGDILIYENKNDFKNIKYDSKKDAVTYVPNTYESGEYAYIFIEGKGFVGVNLGGDGTKGTKDDRDEFSYNYYKNNNLSPFSKDSLSETAKQEYNNLVGMDIYEFSNYQTLLGKDCYAILRPSFIINQKQLYNNYKVGDNYYSTLEEAINAIDTEGKIVLQENVVDNSKPVVPANKKIMIDLNENKIIKTTNQITNKGDLTILGNGEIVTDETSKNKLSYLIYNENNLVLKDVTIENYGNTEKYWYTIYSKGKNLEIDNSIIVSEFDEKATAHAGYDLVIKEEQTININKSSFNSNATSAILLSATKYGEVNANVKIMQSSITGKKGITIACDENFTNKTNLYLKDSTIECEDNAVHSNVRSDCKLTIDGGKLVSNTKNTIIAGGNSNIELLNGNIITNSTSHYTIGIINNTMVNFKILGGTIYSKKSSAIGANPNCEIIIGTPYIEDNSINENVPMIKSEESSAIKKGSLIKYYDGTIIGKSATFASGENYILEDDCEVKQLSENGLIYETLLSNKKEIIKTSGDIKPSGDTNEKGSTGGSSSGGNIIKSYKITTSIDNGKITPDSVKVKKGKNQKFVFEADEDYEIIDVLIDGKSVGVVSEYIFEKVKEKHSIEVKTDKIKAVEVEEENQILDSNTDDYNDTIEKSQTTENHLDTEKGIDNRFVDVSKDDWFYEYVDFVLKRNLFNGTSENKFSPNAKLTRGMLVTILYRLAEANEENMISNFDDVDKDMYYSTPIAWANNNSYVNGIGEKLFAPDNSISRQDLVTIIYRYLKANGFVKQVINYELDFYDKNDISDYAKEAVEYFTYNKILAGKGDNRFDPRGLATRAETAKIIKNVADIINNM